MGEPEHFFGFPDGMGAVPGAKHGRRQLGSLSLQSLRSLGLDATGEAEHVRFVSQPLPASCVPLVVASRTKVKEKAKFAFAETSLTTRETLLSVMDILSALAVSNGGSSIGPQQAAGGTRDQTIRYLSIALGPSCAASCTFSRS